MAGLLCRPQLLWLSLSPSQVRTLLTGANTACPANLDLDQQLAQARILEGLPVFPPGNLPYPGLELMSPALAADSFPLSPQGSPSECLMEI